MRSCCVGLIIILVVLTVAVAAAIAVTAVLSSMAFHWQKDEQRPKLFAILNMLGVMTKRGVDYPHYWASFPIKTRCACNTPPNVLTDEFSNNCPPNDPCNPGPLPITTN